MANRIAFLPILAIGCFLAVVARAECQTSETRLRSPGGQFTSVVSRKTCDVRNPGKFRVILRDERALLFRQETIAYVSGSDSVDVIWLGEDQIVIDLHGGTRTALTTKWHGILIAYRGKAPGAP